MALIETPYSDELCDGCGFSLGQDAYIGWIFEVNQFLSFFI
jgi:hypothetical protein